MRVSIDATPLLLRSAGVKTYVYYWTRHLQSTAGRHTLELFPFLDGARLSENCVHERSVIGFWPTLARLAVLHASNGSPIPILNQLGAHLDVFHASHQLLRPPRNTKLTATLYDMTCWLAPETHTPANVAMAKKFARKVLARADGMIAISENTRSDSVRVLGLKQDRIEVIYPGVAEPFFGAAPAARQKPYILFVGTIEPRKNVNVLLDAYQQLPASLREEYDLVVAGSPGWGDSGALRRLSSAAPGIHYLGYIPEQELPGLTAGATAFVYPSLYEGFGLPVAQAMAAAVPVITSNVSSLPEVGGDAALLVDPRSVAELESAMRRLLLAPSLRAELSANATRRAQQYRWEICASKSWRFFERTCAN
jgi:glycosyltransferase involved in cell wall biosynthesis